MLKERKTMNPTYTYQDVSLVPRTLSKIRTREDIDLSTTLNIGDKTFNFRMPILPAPMDTISGMEMCKAFHKNEMLGMIHRFQSLDKRIEEYQQLKKENIDVFVAVGLEEETVVKQYYDLGARLFVLDIANGFNTCVEPMVRYIKNLKDTFVVCGNVASQEGFEYLSKLGVDAIRVGIGNGSICTTSIMTGVGQGIVSALTECAEIRKELGSQSLIIADGGVTNVGDIAKAVGLGADFIMTGRMFAGTREAEGSTLKYEGKLYKTYRGSASFIVQQKSKQSPLYIEGDETIVGYKGRVQKIFDEIEAGLRSALSYMAAGNLDEFRRNSSFVVYR